MNTAYAAGATSKIVKIRGITISTGLPYTAGAFNTSGLSVQYIRDGGTVQTITQVTATAGTYTSSGFVHAGGGVYEIGAPTAALASGADGVVFFASGISDVLFSTCRVELLGGDPRAAAIDVNVTQISGDSTAADNAEAFFDGTGYVGGTAKLTVNTVQVNGTAQTAGDLAALVTTVDTVVDAILVDTGTTLDGLIQTVDTVVDGIKAKTDSLTFTQAGHVDANIQRVNDVLVAGDGAGTPWGP